MLRRSAVSILISLGLPGLGCRRPRTRPPAVPLDLAPGARVSPSRARAGWPIAVRYRWKTGPQFAGAGRPYRAFVHFVAADRAILIDDDHEPKPSPLRWEPGRTYEYTRLVFTRRQFPGPLELRLGLYDPADGSRPALAEATAVEAGSYRLATVPVDHHPPNDEVLFFSGFSAPWTSHHQPFDAFRWMGREGVVAFRNPRADAVLFLRGYADPRRFTVGPVLSVAIGSVRREHAITLDEPFTIAVSLDRESLGDEAYSDVTLRMNGVFTLSDGSEAGLRLDQAVLCPAGELDPAVVHAV